MLYACGECGKKFTTVPKYENHLAINEQCMIAERPDENLKQDNDELIKTDGLNFIEVCAGAGGLSSGFIKAGFTPVLLNDNDKRCCETLEHNHPETEVVCKSMVDLDLTKYKNKIDLLMGGVPCQSFSQAGKREGLEDDRVI